MGIGGRSHRELQRLSKGHRMEALFGCFVCVSGRGGGERGEEEMVEGGGDLLSMLCD